MKARIWLGRLAAVCCVGALWQATPTLIARAQQAPDASSTPQQAPLDMAVVDLPALIKQHPSYEQLKQLDEALDVQEKKVQLIPHEGEDRARRKVSKQMGLELEKAHAEMKAAETKVRADLMGLSESYRNQLKSQMESLSGEARQELKGEIDKYRQDHTPSAPPSSARPDLSSHNSIEKQRDYLIMRARLIAARRLELERSNRNQLEAERSRLDHALGTYEDQVGSKYQTEKINLQLKMQVSKDEAEQDVIQKRLGKISDDIAATKAKKRAEMDDEFNRLQARLNTELTSNLSSYKLKVDSEVINKLGGRRPAPQPMAVHREEGTTKGPPREIKAKIDALQAKIHSQMEAKEAEIKGRMQAEEQQARAKLEQKRKDIEAHLHKIHDDLEAALRDQETNLDAATKAKLEQAKAGLKKTKDERDALLKKIVADVKGAVGKVAEKKNVPMVIGDVFYSASGITDLTDLSMVAVKESGSK